MKLSAIINISIKECLRHRIVYFIFAGAMLFLLIGKGCDPGTVRGKGVFFDEMALRSAAMAVAFHGIAFWSLVLCSLLSSQVLTREQDEGTAALTLSRPLARSVFLAGKGIGVVLISALNLFLLGTIFVALYYLESGWLNYRIFAGLLLMVLPLGLCALLSMLLSLFLPRLVTPLCLMLLYLGSLGTALPYYFEKLKLIWVPSETIVRLHRLLPPFGDLQFLGAAWIGACPGMEALTGPLVRLLVYGGCAWAIIVAVFSRRAF